MLCGESPAVNMQVPDALARPLDHLAVPRRRSRSGRRGCAVQGRREKATVLTRGASRWRRKAKASRQ
jgi:predicted transcriptional regulator